MWNIFFGRFWSFLSMVVQLLVVILVFLCQVLLFCHLVSSLPRILYFKLPLSRDVTEHKFTCPTHSDAKQFRNFCVWSKKAITSKLKNTYNLLGFLFISLYPSKISGGLLMLNNGFNQRSDKVRCLLYLSPVRKWKSHSNLNREI